MAAFSALIDDDFNDNEHILGTLIAEVNRINDIKNYIHRITNIEDHSPIITLPAIILFVVVGFLKHSRL